MSTRAEDQISPIMAASDAVAKFSASRRRENNAVIEGFRKNRQALIAAAVAQGLRVKPISADFALNDLFEIDDTGRLIETFFKVVVGNLEEAQKTIQFSIDNRLGVIPIGAKTSAIGLFEAHTQALRVGLAGAIGIYLQRAAVIFDKDVKAEFEPYFCQDRSILVLKSLNGSQKHRVIAHAAVTVKEINDFLNSVLDTSKNSYRIMPDPTSMAEAQLGGIIATGAQGGNRTNAAHDIGAVWIVDANGNSCHIEGDEAKDLVGLNGCAGLVLQAEFEVSSFPKYEHGVYVPLGSFSKDAAQRWQDLLRVQEILRPFCQYAPESVEVVTGIELLSAKGLILAQENHGSSFLDRLVALNEEYEFGLFITFNCDYPIGQEEALASKVMQALVGQSLDPKTVNDTLEFDSDESIRVTSGEHPYLKLLYLSDAELVLLDQVRHAVPSSSRELAKRMGGVTESTDINVRVTSEDPLERSKAYEVLAGVYSKYLGGFSTSEGFDAVVYGHMHPGYGIGGGIDPHIRIIFELSNPGSRYNAPEQVAGIKKRKSAFERSLLALNNVHSIVITVPEKSCFGSAEYWNWLCLQHRDVADRRLKLVQKYGSGTDYSERFSFRVPKKTPSYIHPPVGHATLLAKNTFDLCQAPSKSASVQKLNLALHALLHEHFSLAEDQYSFLVESETDVAELIASNGLSERITPVLFEKVKKNAFNDTGSLYVVDCQNIPGAETAKILIASTDHIARAKAKGSVGNLLALWQQWPFFNPEYPATVAAVSLCKALLKLNTAEHISHDPMKTAAVYAGVTPAKFSLGAEEPFWNPTPDEEGLMAAEKLKHLIGLPQEYCVQFFGSVRRTISHLAKKCAQKKHVKVIVIHGDPFADTVLEIFQSQNVPVSAIRIPWTTAENSQLSFVVNKLVDIFTSTRISKEPVGAPCIEHLVFMVPHKSTTTADVHPDHVVKALSDKDLLMGRDYHLVCDISSSAGARNYAKLLSPDTGTFRTSFTGVLGCFHGAFGLPTGCCFMSLAPAIMRMLDLPDAQATLDTQKNSLYKRWLSAFLKGAYVSTAERESECYRKFRLVLGWLEKHKDLICLVPNSVDQSPALLGIFSQAKNLSVARRLLRDIFGHVVDPGYGSFEKESIRIYLANISEQELLQLLACLDVVLDLPDVVLTRGENIPNIALREPHDPLVVLERLSQNLTVDDLIRNQPGLAWISRLIKTFNSNVDDLAQVPIDGENPSGEYKMKARIYAAGVNLREMQKILRLRDTETRLDIIFHYELFRDVERHIRRRVMSDPAAVWADNGNSAAIRALLNSGKEHLLQLSHLLRKFVKGEDPGLKASFDEEGRVRWPIVA